VQDDPARRRYDGDDGPEFELPRGSYATILVKRLTEQVRPV
jgi:tRNA(Glu) U13 pseudouridine synthase TruD